MQPSASPKVKFCGFTQEADIAVANELEIDFIGLIFAAKSPRCLTWQQAERLRANISSSIQVVALVMNQSVADIQPIIEKIRPDFLQFHGNEHNTFCQQFNIPFFKAVAMGNRQNTVTSYLEEFPDAFGFVFDGHAAGEQGGSGQVFDWNTLPSHLQKPYLLAGGLSEKNIANAIATTQPWGVDVSSGIEVSPGIKSHEKMRAFIQEIR